MAIKGGGRAVRQGLTFAGVLLSRLYIFEGVLLVLVVWAGS